MVATPIPRWLVALDARKPYIEVLNDRKLPQVSPQFVHGIVAGALNAVLRDWACGRGVVGVEIRFYFRRDDGRWSSLLPDVCYASFERFPELRDEISVRPRIAPDIAVEVYSPDDRPGRMKRKVETYLEFGSSLVLVLYPKKRRVVLHRPNGCEERDARGAWALVPVDDLVIDWDDVYRDLRFSR